MIIKSLLMINDITDITNSVSGFFFVLIYAGMVGLACIVCGLFFLVWIISKIIIVIILVVAPILLTCAMFPLTSKCNELVTSDFNAFSGNSLVDRKLCSTIVPIVDELNQGGSLSL